MDFKAHIIKLEKAILYQPVFISKDMVQRVKLANQVIKAVPGLDVTPGGYPELTKSVAYLGMTYYDSSIHSILRFKNNEERDIYYEELITSIEYTIKYLKNVRISF